MSLPRSLRHVRRLEMDLRTRGIPDIPLVGRYHYTRAQPALREHMHRNAIEILFFGNWSPELLHGRPGLPVERGRSFCCPTEQGT